MPTIEILQEWIPEGCELTGRMVYASDCPATTEILVAPKTIYKAGSSFIYSYPELRRKPRLKRIVFEVAGEARREFKRGEFYEPHAGEDVHMCERDVVIDYPRIPLTRREEFE